MRGGEVKEKDLIRKLSLGIERFEVTLTSYDRGHACCTCACFSPWESPWAGYFLTFSPATQLK